MKKFILSVFLVICTLTAGAQEYCQHEISLSYGIITPSGALGMVQQLIAKALSGLTDDEFSSSNTGALSVEYFYRLSELVSVGGVASYHGFSATLGDSTMGIKAYTLMPAVKLSWYNREWFSSYSKFAVGASLVAMGTEKPKLWPNGQFSLLGLEFGRSVRVFAEFGFGEQGLALGGLRYRF